MKIGARIYKTAIAVVLCVYLGTFLQGSSGFFAAVAAIITMQSTFSDSFFKGMNRIFGTFIGAFFGYIFALIYLGNPLLIGIGIILIIYISKALNRNEFVVIACVVFISIMLDGGKNILQSSIFRLLDTSAGIIIALIVNYFVFPHKPVLAVYNECEKLMEDFPTIIDKVLVKKENIDLEDTYNEIVELREKSMISEYDLILHQESQREVKRLDNIVEGLLTIYEHLVFIEELRNTESIFIPSEIIDDAVEEKKLPDIIIEFHKQQIYKKWDRVKWLWDKKAI